jgi:hypothetical protein
MSQEQKKRTQNLSLSTKQIVVAIAMLLVALSLFLWWPEGRRDIRTSHFMVRFSSSLDVGEVYTLVKVLEENYTRISDDLKTIPADNIEVNIYASRWGYIKATGQWHTAGFTQTASSLSFVQQPWSKEQNMKLAIHEFTHVVVLKLIANQKGTSPGVATGRPSAFPVWLWEAVACYEAKQLTDPKKLPLFKNGQHPGWQQLNEEGSDAISLGGYTLTEYILHQYGTDKLIELIGQFGDTQKTLGVTEADFLKGWYQFLRHQYWGE